MLVFAASDKGGTGRSVTGCNILYRWALTGVDVCYLDFDFGSPTVGTIFQVDSVGRGTPSGGLHSYLTGSAASPHRVDVWTESERPGLRTRTAGTGQLVLFPGDEGGGEFPIDPQTVQRCADLLLRLEEEFDVCLVDLSAGRSYATQLALAVTARPALAAVPVRWLVFHRWTRQHILAAAGLVHGRHGLADTGEALGHDRAALLDSIRYVRTAVVDLDSAELAGLRPGQIAWLRDCNQDLQELASRNRMGRTTLLGSAPLEPLLQWREQIISDNDVWGRGIANQATIEAFDRLARAVTDAESWERL
ncbi:SCO2523 family variant P-loop protein [Micromonospora harpali]|uniref:SCO2523 family variant P-loop protein n=1 Tax=Micromonospora harpali TaxID=1490225 RepID=A0ABW1HRM0_9ACTN|nr:SCO2523 family variant P-loop protein [Micromonospora sp. NBRC 110038]